MKKIAPTNYRVVIAPTLGGDSLFTLHLDRPKEAFQFKVLEKLGFSDKEMLHSDNTVQFKRPREYMVGSFSTKATLFMEMYWKLNRLFLSDLTDEDQKVINSIGMDMRDAEDGLELVVINLDLTKARDL